MKKLILFALALLSSAVFAQALPVPGTSPVFPITQSGNVWTFGPGSATSANAASLTFGNAANGAVYAEGSASLGVGGGRFAPVAVRALPAAANVAKAVGNMALRWTGVLGVGIALYDLAKELGFNVSNNTGTLIISKPSGFTCNVTYPNDTYFNMSGVTSIKRCLPQSAGSSVYTYGWEHTSTQFGWSGVTFPCGNASCPTGSLWYSLGTTGNVSLNPDLPSTVQEFQDAIAAKSGWPSGSAIGRALTDAVAKGEVLPLPQPSIITGPTLIPLAPSIVFRPDGSSTVTQPNKNLVYSPPSVTSTDSTVITERDTAGNPIAPPTTEQKPSELPQTCGYPGGPPCKIDESGTPDKVQEKEYNPKVDQLKTNKEAGLDKMGGKDDKGALYNNYSVFFSAPAFVACEPVALPAFKGVSMGAIDACPVVDGMREVMGYLWAAGGLFLCLGFIRQTV